VALADGATNAVPSLAALRDLVRPPDGMTAIELEDGHDSQIRETIAHFFDTRAPERFWRPLLAG
jgi:hypothetical protein